MTEFNVNAYKAQLEASKSCELCETVPVPSLAEDTDYVFISYSHLDYKSVYSDLADLYASGVPFWYDGGLPAGQNWDHVVRQKIHSPHCKGVIFYHSENFFRSDAIADEIRFVCGTGDAAQARTKYFCVNLTQMRPSEILRTLETDERFTQMDAACKEQWLADMQTAFPDKATYLPFHKPNHAMRLTEQIHVVFGICPNYNLYPFGGEALCSGNGVIRFVNGSIYDGAFVDNLFDDHGKLTYSDGSFYEGEWKDGKRHGAGVLYRADGSAEYRGGWREDKQHGGGISYRIDGTECYKGEWCQGKREGWGASCRLDGTSEYVGNWKNGERHGEGTTYDPYGLVIYDGDWEENLPHGIGEYTYENGNRYMGEWVRGRREGQGILCRADRSVIYEGAWQNDQFCGQGVYRWSNGFRYEGAWRDNMCCGHGVLYRANGSVKYEGEWRENQRNGHGVCYESNGSVYIGEWLDGKKHGVGTLTLPDGTVQTGRFEEDRFIGG